MRILDRERERGAHLIAVERAVARPAHPARALPRPIHCAGILTRRRAAGLVAAEAGATRPEVFHAREAPETEALVGKPNRAVGIALAGGDGVAEPGDQQIAHLDLRHDALRRAVGQHDVDGCDGRLAIAHPELHLLDAIGLDRPGGTVAVVEAPDASFIRRLDAFERDADAVVARTEIGFPLAVAIAGFQQAAGAVDAQPLDRVARPAAAVGVLCEQLLGLEHAVARAVTWRRKSASLRNRRKRFFTSHSIRGSAPPAGWAWAAGSAHRHAQRRDKAENHTVKHRCSPGMKGYRR